jgi:hypothetical protein
MFLKCIFKNSTNREKPKSSSFTSVSRCNNNGKLVFKRSGAINYAPSSLFKCVYARFYTVLKGKCATLYNGEENENNGYIFTDIKSDACLAR